MSDTALRTLKATACAALAVLGFWVGVEPALAAKIKNPVATFAGLDKITGRTTTFDVYIDETVQFGALQVTPRVCYSRDETEAQKQSAFLEVDEITLDRKIRRIFTGWMFAASPGLNAVDHPIYDIWLTGCKMTSDVPAPKGLKVDSTPIPTTPAKPATDAPPPVANEGEGLSPDAPIDSQPLPELTNPDQDIGIFNNSN